MDYSESLAYLGQIQEDGAKFSLDNIQIIINHFPFDLRKINFVQVGGTNGKGSTSHGIASVLREGGYQVGLFTSPHLFDLRERIALNKEWISREAFARSLTCVRELTTRLLSSQTIPTKPSFFEHMLLTALFFFHEQNVDFAVLEVGLGGRLDATTAIKPVLSVITNVNHDHMKILGSSLDAIAREKAGIIKNGVPLVCACPPKTAGYRVIRSRCLELDAPFEAVFGRTGHLNTDQECGGTPVYRYKTAFGEYAFGLSMNGRHQALNAATIIRAAEVLNALGITCLSEKHILDGLRKNQVPGRLEWFDTNPPILIDGGHNVAGMKSLAGYLEERNQKNFTLIFGVLKDKQYRRMIREIRPYIKRVILTEPQSHRAKKAVQLRPLFAPLPVSVQTDYDQALSDAISHAEPILITGSLYLIGGMRDKIETIQQHTHMEVPS